MQEFNDRQFRHRVKYQIAGGLGTYYVEAFGCDGHKPRSLSHALDAENMRKHRVITAASLVNRKISIAPGSFNENMGAVAFLEAYRAIAASQVPFGMQNHLGDAIYKDSRDLTMGMYYRVQVRPLLFAFYERVKPFLSAEQRDVFDPKYCAALLVASTNAVQQLTGNHEGMAFDFGADLVVGLKARDRFIKVSTTVWETIKRWAAEVFAAGTGYVYGSFSEPASVQEAVDDDEEKEEEADIEAGGEDDVDEDVAEAAADPFDTMFPEAYVDVVDADTTCIISREVADLTVITHPFGCMELPDGETLSVWFDSAFLDEAALEKLKEDIHQFYTRQISARRKVKLLFSCHNHDKPEVFVMYDSDRPYDGDPLPVALRKFIEGVSGVETADDASHEGAIDKPSRKKVPCYLQFCTGKYPSKTVPGHLRKGIERINQTVRVSKVLDWLCSSIVYDQRIIAVSHIHVSCSAIIDPKDETHSCYGAEPDYVMVFSNCHGSIKAYMATAENMYASDNAVFVNHRVVKPGSKFLWREKVVLPDQGVQYASSVPLLQSPASDQSGSVPPGGLLQPLTAAELDNLIFKSAVHAARSFALRCPIREHLTVFDAIQTLKLKFKAFALDMEQEARKNPAAIFAKEEMRNISFLRSLLRFKNNQEDISVPVEDAPTMAQEHIIREYLQPYVDGLLNHQATWMIMISVLSGRDLPSFMSQTEAEIFYYNSGNNHGWSDERDPNVMFVRSLANGNLYRHLESARQRRLARCERKACCSERRSTARMSVLISVLWPFVDVLILMFALYCLVFFNDSSDAPAAPANSSGVNNSAAMEAFLGFGKEVVDSGLAALVYDADHDSALDSSTADVAAVTASVIAYPIKPSDDGRVVGDSSFNYGYEDASSYTTIGSVQNHSGSNETAGAGFDVDVAFNPLFVGGVGLVGYGVNSIRLGMSYYITNYFPLPVKLRDRALACPRLLRNHFVNMFYSVDGPSIVTQGLKLALAFTFVNNKFEGCGITAMPGYGVVYLIPLATTIISMFRKSRMPDLLQAVRNDRKLQKMFQSMKGFGRVMLWVGLPLAFFEQAMFFDYGCTYLSAGLHIAGNFSNFTVSQCAPNEWFCEKVTSGVMAFQAAGLLAVWGAGRLIGKRVVCGGNQLRMHDGFYRFLLGGMVGVLPLVKVTCEAFFYVQITGAIIKASADFVNVFGANLSNEFEFLKYYPENGTLTIGDESQFVMVMIFGGSMAFVSVSREFIELLRDFRSTVRRVESIRSDDGDLDDDFTEASGQVSVAESKVSWCAALCCVRESGDVKAYGR